MQWTSICILLLLPIAMCERLMIRHTTAEGGHQARAATSTDYVTHFCQTTTQPLAVKACGADTITGGNPSPVEASTPINLFLQCGDSETLVCATLGTNITQMCCEAVLPTGFSAQCTLILRVYNGGSGTTTLVTGQVDAWEATSDDLARLPHVLGTPPTLPKPIPGQTRPLLTSVASLTPFTVPFNNRHTEKLDAYFYHCGANAQVTFGVHGTVLSAESEVFICEKGNTNCGAQANHGTDNVVTVFHSVQSKMLEYGKEYFIRVFSYGHENTKPTIDVTVANTAVQPPAKVFNGLL